MKLLEFSDVRNFSDRVSAFLLEREAERCIELGIIDRLLKPTQRTVRGEELARPLLWAVEDKSVICAVAMQSVKKRLVVSRGPDAAMELIAEKLAENQWGEGTIIGVVPVAQQVCEAYARRAGLSMKRSMQMRLFALREVIAPATASGSMRMCEERDRELLRQWTVRFFCEVGDPIPESEAHARGEQMASGLIEDRRGWFWVDEQDVPRAMAAHVGPAPNGVRINFVYTPPDCRNRGYASNLVAALSRHQLNTGCTFCALFTDLANPTSNSIYQKMGYRPVADCESWEVASASARGG